MPAGKSYKGVPKVSKTAKGMKSQGTGLGPAVKKGKGKR